MVVLSNIHIAYRTILSGKLLGSIEGGLRNVTRLQYIYISHSELHGKYGCCALARAGKEASVSPNVIKRAPD